MDLITDFQSGIDRLDLSAIDANLGFAGNQAFKLVPFGGGAGTVSFVHVNGNTIVAAWVDGDAVTDLVFELTGLHDLQVTDFVV
jgi:serralysin